MPLLGRLLRRGFALADKIVPATWPQACTAEALIAAAQASPDADSREGLAQLLASLAAESELSLFGRLSLRWDLERLLRNAQAIAGAHAANPALAAAPIEAPVFILGLPRAGTTFLHELLARDPANAVPRHWQTVFPAPRPANFNAALDSRVRQANRQLSVFAGLAPGFAGLHPITAESPQECSEITAHVFQSLRFDTTHRVPSYLRWLDANGHHAAFAFHKRFLQVLQNGSPARWVLKCPDDTFALDAILHTYPDARFVIVHRDPVAVIGSVAHLTAVLRRPFLERVDLAEIGAQVSQRWTEGANLLLDFDNRVDVPPERKLHLHYRDVTTAPLGVVARIYARFGLPLDSSALAAMARHVNARPRGGYGAHAPYRLEDFGLTEAALRPGFAPYVAQFCAPSPA
jgi:hypothetical protein